jgi:hypothetical protein
MNTARDLGGRLWAISIWGLEGVYASRFGELVV